MSLRFRDLWAPAWSLTLTGQRLVMRPLSLGTFAYLEGEGVTLPSLSGKASPGMWARLTILLADLDGDDADEERVIGRLMKDPVAWKRLQHTLIESLQHRNEAAERQKAQRRQVKNPLDKKPKPDDRDEAEPESEELDATFVLLTARLSGLSLADISKMSFRGLLGLQEWLKENPPQPSGLGGLLG